MPSIRDFAEGVRAFVEDNFATGFDERSKQRQTLFNRGKGARSAIVEEDFRAIILDSSVHNRRIIYRKGTNCPFDKASFFPNGFNHNDFERWRTNCKGNSRQTSTCANVEDGRIGFENTKNNRPERIENMAFPNVAYFAGRQQIQR